MFIKDRLIVHEGPHHKLKGGCDQSVLAVYSTMGIVRVFCETPEDEVVRRWWSLPAGCLLPLSNGDTYQLLFAGRKGSAAGPDVRDAVFSVIPASQRSATPPHAQRLVGDVEFHVHSSAWSRHQHHTDARYNNVILHVVLICDDPASTRCATGATIPVCSLNDLPVALNDTDQISNWPCQHVVPQLSAEALARLLKQAGLLRFEQKAHTFVERLRSMPLYNSAFVAYDMCLVPALAEGLGYGRDRDFFRAAGNYLLGLPVSLPEPLGRAPQPAPLDAHRLRVLATLVNQWRFPGIWQTLRAILLADSAGDHAMRLRKLRSLFCDPGLSLTRTDILLCNVVLPFAMAVALQEHDTMLAERAQQLYEQHPGLPSNRVTRMMCVQLRLPTEPLGSCRQQGLHYIYQQTCREKCCDVCLMGKWQI